MLWTIALIMLVGSLALIAYLLKDRATAQLFPLQLTFSNVIDFVLLIVSVFALFVAIASLRETVESGKQQQISLDASRKMLEAVVETTKSQQEVQAQSLETSIALLVLQKEEQNRAKELASRRAKLRIFIGDKGVDTDTVETTLVTGQDNKGQLLLGVQNVGLAPLHQPVFKAAASRKDVSLRFNGAVQNASEPYWTQLSGRVLDVLPVTVSKTTYDSSIFVTAAPSVSNFDLTYHVAGENMDSPFSVLIHVHLKRE